MTRCFSVVCAFAWALLAVAMCISQDAWAQSEPERVIWKIHCTQLSPSQCQDAESVIAQILSLSSQEHIIGERTFMRRVVSGEGLRFPECFIEGGPCVSGKELLLGAYQAAGVANATFSMVGSEWKVVLQLYRKQIAQPSVIEKSSVSLPNMMQSVLGSLFELNAGLYIKSSIPKADVFINDKYFGMTPVAVKVPPGDLTILLKKDGYQSEEMHLMAKKGQYYSNTIELLPRNDVVETVVKVAPDGANPGDANEFELQKQAAREAMKARAQAVKMQNNAFTATAISPVEGVVYVDAALLQGYEHMRTEAQLQNGRAQTEAMQKLNTLEAAKEVSVSLNSPQTDVSVYLGKEHLGNLPLTVKLPAGELKITFKKKGYVSETWLLDAKSGQSYTKVVELEPMEAQ